MNYVLRVTIMTTHERTGYLPRTYTKTTGKMAIITNVLYNKNTFYTRIIQSITHGIYTYTLDRYR